MKKKCLILLMVLFAFLVKGQDVITLKTGEQIKAKVLEVGTEEIKYKKFGVDDSPVYSVKKSDVDKINYQNGTQDVFNEPDKTSTNSEPDKIDYYGEGVKDAQRYYASFTCPGATGTFYTALLFSIGGLIPAIACSSTPPKDKNLHMRQTPLKDDANYMEGYRDEAFRIKRHRVWLNFGIGAAIGITASLLLENIK